MNVRGLECSHGIEAGPVVLDRHEDPAVLPLDRDHDASRACVLLDVDQCLFHDAVDDRARRGRRLSIQSVVQMCWDPAGLHNLLKKGPDRSSQGRWSF